MTLARDRRGRWALGLVLATALLALAPLQGQASGPTAGASAVRKVEIRNFAFHPATLKIDRGDRVSFVNSSKVTHTASRASFDTRRIAPGESVRVRFKRRGTFPYHCKVHPFMRGKIVVG